VSAACARSGRGFTLIELLCALVVLSLLGLMSYRGLGAVMDARDHLKAETEKWRRADLFFARFERDVRLSAPRTVRSAAGSAAAPWLGRPASTETALLEFSRFGSSEGLDTPRRVGYRLNARQEIELWLWPGLDVAAASAPARYPVLGGVQELGVQYLGAALVWVDSWPAAPGDAAIPLAVRLRVVLATGEELVRVFALRS